MASSVTSVSQVPIPSGSYNLDTLGNYLTGKAFQCNQQPNACSMSAPQAQSASQNASMCASQSASMGASHPTMTTTTTTTNETAKQVNVVVSEQKINPILAYILLALFTGIFLVLYRPTWVTSRNKETGEYDLMWGMVVLYSLIIGFGLFLLYLLLKALFLR